MLTEALKTWESNQRLFFMCALLFHHPLLTRLFHRNGGAASTIKLTGRIDGRKFVFVE
jgi:hypothetical protein